jgi:sialate O-acetylesterase
MVSAMIGGPGENPRMTRPRLHRIAALASMALAASVASAVKAQTAAPVFARIFGDHAVLQRDRPIKVWGTAAPGQGVTLSLGGRSANATADAHGRWRATLPAMAAGGPFELTASAGRAATTLKDIEVGDVYLCAGQSNMEFPVKFATDAWGGFGDSANDRLRFVNIQKDSEPAPLDDLKSPVEWKVVSPATVGDASAVCYFMARSLQKAEKVPVGFIGSDWGGTTIQGWINAPSLRTLKAYRQGVDAVAFLAANPRNGLEQEDRRQEAWWEAHDPRAKAERAWAAPDFNDSAWRSLTPSGSWKAAGIPELADFDGVVWFRTAVTLTEAQARAANELLLGPIDSYDSTWINGVWVGASAMSWVWRDYTVPPGVFRPGRNVIAVRVLSSDAAGGLTGDPEQRGIKTSDGGFIPISGPWKYRTGSRLKGFSPPPAPWAVPTSFSTLYNGMIAPIATYGFKLAAWYQGEANAGAAQEYRTLLPLLVSDWRRSFAEPQLPFLVAQLASFGPVATKPGSSDWAELRAAQATAVRGDAHAGLAVTLDLGDRFSIHPTQKTVVGERLARAARAVAYGEAVTPGGPEAVSVTRSGEDLVVSFKNTNGGLRTYSADVAIGFESCAGDRCSYAPGTVSGAAVVLHGANRPGVTRVRYAWADAPYVNLYSADDLPAVPFQLDVR